MALNNANNATYGLQGTYRGDAITKGKADVFIPELWSSEVKRFLDAKLVFAKYLKQIPFTGKKGDRIHIPNISRAAVNNKLPEVPVTLQARTEGDFYFDIDQYKESSFMLEDIVGIQAAYNLRSEYTREAGYALARDIDNAVLALRAAVYGVASQVVNSTSTGVISTGTSAPLTYSAILSAKLILDRNDVPEEGRMLLVSPTQYNQLLAVEKFINMDYRSEKPVSTGQVGTIFGMPVIMSSQVTVNSATGYVNGTGATPAPTPGVTGSPYLPTQDTYTVLPLIIGGGSDTVSTAIMFHKDFAVIGMQQEPKTESSRETLYLADAVVMSSLYGTKMYRSDHAVVINTNNLIPAIS